MFTCHCLNVVLQADLSQEPEPSEEQFEAVSGEQWTIAKLRGVTRAHPSLTRDVLIGQWRVERCLNCGQRTHATNQSRPGRCWLNVKLLDEEAANNLKSSDLVSAIFNVVIDPYAVDLDASCHSVDSWYGNVEGVVNDLNGVVGCYVGKEQARIEEEIRQFSERQYEKLNNLKEKAMKERDALVRNAIKESLDLPPPTPKVPITAATQKVTSHHDDDVMLMFPFEEFDQPCDSDDDEIDEDEDVVREGVAIPRQPQQQRERSCGVAKSCPVDIPNYARPVQRPTERDEIEGNAAQCDIAANIRALAKSVHGDAIFGELPRPKFSTQI